MKTKEKIFEKLNSIDVTLAEQHTVLKEHMRRTEALEETVGPITKQVAMNAGVYRFIAFLSVLATIAEALHWMLS